jgi:hypothetical protein
MEDWEIDMNRKKCGLLGLLIIALLLHCPLLAGESVTASFEGETPGAAAKDFTAMAGVWHIDRDGTGIVYAVDGRKWEEGLMAEGVLEKAKGLYGERYAEFLDNLEAYKYFPLSVFNEVKDFGEGTITVSFKPVSGRVDQAAGIAFNIQPNGDYLMVRANALENNLVLFKMERGKRSSVQWIRNAPTPSNQWQSLKVVVSGRRIEGYLNEQKFIDYEHNSGIRGKVGLWSKADSYVFFKDLAVTSR